MSYRGDGEPEYIDDDEYFDPDDLGRGQRSGDGALGASGRQSSNVLGASGVRRSSNSDIGPSANPSSDSPASDASGSVRGSMRERVNRPVRGSRKGKAKAAKQRDNGSAQKNASKIQRQICEARRRTTCR